MTTLNLSVITRKEIKEDIAESVMNGDMVAAKIRLVILEEMITEEGFYSIEEISEYYRIKKFINNNI